MQDKLEQIKNGRDYIKSGNVTDALEIFENVAKTDAGLFLVFNDLEGLYRQILETLPPGSDRAKELSEKLIKIIARHEQKKAVEQRRSRGFSGTKIDGDGSVFADLSDNSKKWSWERAGADVRLELTLTLTPHLDVSSIDTSETFSVLIYLDKSGFHEGEEGEKVVVSPGTELQVQLVTTAHFEVIGDPHRKGVVNPDQEAYRFEKFDVRRVPLASSIDGDPAISALFTSEGRACGNVKRQIDLNAIVIPNTIEEQDPIEVIPETGGTPDLTIIIMNNPINDGRQFHCIVSSPHLPDYREGKDEPWNLSDRSEAIVSGFMQRFTDDNTPPTQLVAELIGAGKLLFEASPSIFQKAYWDLAGQDGSVKSIAVVSEEAFVPWELMVPTGGPEGMERESALGVDCTVGRWIYKSKAPRQTLRLTNSTIVAPSYSGSQTLAQSGPEANAVNLAFPGKIVRPASFDEVASELKQSRSLVHFVCHGKDETAKGQLLLLDGGQQLTDTGLRGILGLKEAFAKRAPVVFLNACEVGRGNPALIGPRGFAAQFIKLGALAVIAPLWSVEDSIAHEIALEFYLKAKARSGRPLAEIFQEIRKRAYQSGRDSYAAYCFFGDPLARVD
ncbi:CHAT domain-containing protein [Rhizobium ruizarguesonis]